MIWTVGHSTRPLELFIGILNSFSIRQLVDVRHYPGSRKYPHFNKNMLDQSLSGAGIYYEHIGSLGGRRKPKEDSENTAWRHPAFRGYADYMETEPFREGLTRLKELASVERTVYMCSEAVWWRCHRALISDQLKAEGWVVFHIMDMGKAQEHPYTAPAGIMEGKLTYKQKK